MCHLLLFIGLKRMFTVYYANQLENQKNLLTHLLEVQPLDDPFEKNIILVQSPGMAQWLQLQLADHFGIAANFAFPMPSTFIWQLYKSSIPFAGEKNLFSKENLVWRLMRLIPPLLVRSEFSSLRNYLGEQYTEIKLFQLSEKIADLFDQYLVYRPEWINQWETGEFEVLAHKITQNLAPRYQPLTTEILQDLAWQAILWQNLISDLQAEYADQPIWHRANLYQYYLALLQQGKIPDKLPKRICVFGISALPPMFVNILHALSQYIDIHLFFNNPSRYYWGDIIDHRYLEKLKIKQLEPIPLPHQAIKTRYDEMLSSGHPLLSSWGKLGRDFLYSLTQLEPQEIEVYIEPQGEYLLQQIQRSILNLNDPQSEQQHLSYQAQDHSLSFHACHSPMREVEVLHDNLLAMFAEDPSLTPKDIVVMVADIDRYTPYIQAVFSQYHAEDKRHIPYAISDRKVTESDVVIATFLQFFTFKEALFSVETVLSLLDVTCIQQRFAIEADELEQIRTWVVQSGIRFGLYKQDTDHVANYNAWQNGIERMLLGYALKSEAGVWQDSVGFDYSEGLHAKLAGKLAHFIHALQTWHQQLQQPLLLEQWRTAILNCIETFFVTTENSRISAILKQAAHQIIDTAIENNYHETLSAEVISELLQQKLNEQDNSVHFLMGQLNFCTLLPMRAIPFKVICLLGMNNGDFPRQLPSNSFDVMQYQVQKGDRARREDDCYLFLEAILSAREKLYISYVGYSIIDNTEYEPSVLVGQLLNYIEDNLIEPKNIAHLKHTYPATIFSRHNFIEPHFSYTKEWAQVAALQMQQKQLIPFNGKIDMAPKEHKPIQIELDELIQFVTFPQKYFFERKLGVYLNQNEQALDESEVFSIDALIQYNLKERLLQQNENDWSNEFEKAKREGILPRAGFAFLQRSDLEDTCAKLWNVIANYQQMDAESLKIKLPLNIQGQECILQGQIDQLYQGQYINWRAGKIRDQEKIQLWLIHLLLQIEGENTTSTCYGLNSDNVELLTYAPLDREQALSQLTIYLQSFFKSQQEICFIPTFKLKEFYQIFSAQEFQEEEFFYQENQIDETNKQYYYRQRLSLQIAELNVNEIKNEFMQWFDFMLKTANISD